MAEKSKDRNREVRPQGAVEKKAPKPATKRAESPAPSGEGSPKAAQAMPPQEPEAVSTVTPEDRWNMIADAAYYRAEKRGFVGGDPAEDWLAAEAEIDAQIAEQKLSEKE